MSSFGLRSVESEQLSSLQVSGQTKRLSKVSLNALFLGDLLPLEQYTDAVKEKDSETTDASADDVRIQSASLKHLPERPTIWCKGMNEPKEPDLSVVNDDDKPKPTTTT